VRSTIESDAGAESIPVPVAGICVLDLAPHLNNVGATLATGTAAGRLNVWGNSFAAEHLPPGGSEVVVDGVPFRLPPLGSGDADNVRCAGQMIDVPAGRYDWLHLLVTAERRVEDEVTAHFADGTADFEALRVSDFWAAPPSFGECVAYRSPVMHYPRHVQSGVPATLWCQRVPIVRRGTLTAVRLPHNVAVHVFAATLVLSDRRPPG
jgi:hypothetical protein